MHKSRSPVNNASIIILRRTFYSVQDDQNEKYLPLVCHVFTCLVGVATLSEVRNLYLALWL